LRPGSSVSWWPACAEKSACRPSIQDVSQDRSSHEQSGPARVCLIILDGTVMSKIQIMTARRSGVLFPDVRIGPAAGLTTDVASLRFIRRGAIQRAHDVMTPNRLDQFGAHGAAGVMCA